MDRLGATAESILATETRLEPAERNDYIAAMMLQDVVRHDAAVADRALRRLKVGDPRSLSLDLLLAHYARVSAPQGLAH